MNVLKSNAPSISMCKCFAALLVTEKRVKNTCTEVFVMLFEVFENCFKGLIEIYDLSSFHWRNLKMPALCFSADRKHFENEAFLKTMMSR